MPLPVPNGWNVFATDELFVWESTLSAGLPAAAMLDWQAAVLTAGEKHSVMRVLSAPAWDYRRDRDGPVLTWLRRRPTSGAPGTSPGTGSAPNASTIAPSRR